MNVLARLVIYMYQKHMGHVDRMDKNVALSRLRLKRCMKRYHRAIFVWYLAIILNNVMVLFLALFANADELQKSKDGSVGFKHWFQLEVSHVLIKHGLKLARQHKLKTAALRVTSFCRLCLAKLRCVRLRQTAQPQIPQRQINRSRRSVRVCQLQSVRARGRGRRKKRRRGPGRPSSGGNDRALPVSHRVLHVQDMKCI